MQHPTLRLASVLALLAAAPVWAQPSPNAGGAAATSAPAREVPKPDQLEPGVDTSATPPANDSPEPPKTSSSQEASPATEDSRATPEKRSSKATAAKATAQPASPPANTAGSSEAQTAQRKAGADKAHDSIQLDTTDITGNRELPKVLYIVPWKRSDLGDLVGKPANSLLDEVLAPVDRDVFKRENRYYDALKPDAGGTPGPGTAGPPAAGAAPESGGKP